VAKPDLAATAKRLYEHFLAPLVLGGDLTPGPAVGALAALSLEGSIVAVDRDVRSAVDVARVRVARRLVPMDTLDGPDADEWALAGALHDLVHALHPSFRGVLREAVPDKLLDFADQVVERVRPAGSLGDALSRHSYFARAFAIERTDTVVSWWTGSRWFLGSAPPPRLLAWPELRRVHSDTTTHTLAALVLGASTKRRARFDASLTRLLAKVPLTDLATAARPSPAFAWSDATLALFATPHARTVALRALALGPLDDVDAALGRATRPHVEAAAWENVARIADVLGERALVAAACEGRARLEAGPAEASPDADYARVLGAVVALARLGSVAATESSARSMTARLLPLAQSPRGRDVGERLRRAGAIVDPRTGYFLPSVAALENAAGSVGGSRTSSEAYVMTPL
jgi:hypothetical protein